MHKQKRFAILASASLIILLLTLVGGPMAPAFAAAKPAPATAVNYALYATDGWWTMADGTPIYSYGYIGGRVGSVIHPLNNDGTQLGGAAGITVSAPTSGPATAAETALGGHAQFPAPMITCAAGDIVTITLKNLGVYNPAQPGTGYIPTAPNDPHTVHLHGLDVDVANDGVPETSVAAIPANDPLLAGGGNLVVYMFSPKTVGSYFYHCHQEADIHVTMGMYGALIVYNPGEAGATTGPGSPGSLFGFKYDKDYVLIMSDTDVRQHMSESTLPVGQADPGGVFGFTGSFNPVDYKPQYWFLNGISFPNTIHASTGTFNWANWVAAHPGYDPMITGNVTAKQKVLVRMVNMGFETQPMHIHGFHPKVLGKDQRAWDWSAKSMLGAGLEVNTITIGSGEEYDLLIDFSAQAVTSTYQAGTQSRYNPANNSPQVNGSAFPAIPEGGDPLSTGTYIGGPVVSGAIGIPGTSQIFVFHNHDDYKATNNGVYPGGMFTIVVPQ